MKKANPKGSSSYTKRNGKPRKELAKLINEGLAEAGILNSDPKGSPKVIYKYASNETIFANPGGASITLGLDRPDSRGSGYGARGLVGLQDKSIGSSRIDLVVGRLASANDGDGVRPGTYVDNNFQGDAARIYICETTDVDLNFGLTEGIVGNPKGVSTVAIKSDQTRIIGRSGIKICTGPGQNWKPVERTSKGGKLPVAGGVDIICGNVNGDRVTWNPWDMPETILDLQPIVKAYNIRDYLKESSALLDDVYSAVLNLSMLVKGLAGVIVTLPSTYTILFGNPAAPILASLGAMMASLILSFIGFLVDNPIYQSRAQKMPVEFDYLDHAGYKFIGSRSVRST
jgi:hypothetical protein